MIVPIVHRSWQRVNQETTVKKLHMCYPSNVVPIVITLHPEHSISNYLRHQNFLKHVKPQGTSQCTLVHLNVYIASANVKLKTSKHYTGKLYMDCQQSSSRGKEDVGCRSCNCTVTENGRKLFLTMDCEKDKNEFAVLIKILWYLLILLKVRY